MLIAGDWLQVIFNPSFPYRFTHMLLASGLTASFVVAGLSAWRLLQRAGGRRGAAHAAHRRRCVAAVLAPLQIFVGDLHGLNTLEHQPAKIAAMEALWKTEKGAPLVLFAHSERGDAGATTSRSRCPSGASLILKHDADGEVKGMDAFAPDTPPVAPLFFAFRVMVGMGVLMLALAWIGAWRLRKRRSCRRAGCCGRFAGFTFSGWVATLAGWLVTEIGRQPWLVTGILRTADAVGTRRAKRSSARASPATSLTYALMLVAYMVVLTHLAGQGRTA